jgi:SAM-dependent methyltransferase
MKSEKDCYDIRYQKQDAFSYNEILYTYYIKSLIRFIGLKNGSRVLDVGCGQGFFSHIFNKLGMKSFGIDISSTGILSAHKSYAAEGVNFLIGDVKSMPFSTAFECVFVRSCSIYNKNEFSQDNNFTKYLLNYVVKDGYFIFIYNTNFSSSKESKNWKYHSYCDLKEHFSGYKNADFFFISKIDTFIANKCAFSKLFTNINIIASYISGMGGDLVCIIKKT